MPPSEAMVETLVAEGVKHVFGIVGSNLPANPDYAKLAEDMGALGFTADHPDQVGDIMKEAIASGRPCVINAVFQGGEEVRAEPIRRDALQMPVRHLDKYAHLNAK